MNLHPKSRFVFFTAVLSLIVAFSACNKLQQTVDSAKEPVNTGEPAEVDQPLGHVVEFNDFTLRANVSRASVLNDAMAQKYDIAVRPDLAVLNLVILKNNAKPAEATVQAQVSAKHENLLGHTEDITMKPIETDGYISYVGTIDASSQRVFQLIISAVPEGTEQPLQMNFDVQLDW